ncbi:MAG: hypothetical protein AAGN35_05345 [Bacteroidota bacterium]
MRAVPLLLLLLCTAPLRSQSQVDAAYALELTERLTADPLHPSHSTDARLLFSWLDDTQDLLRWMNFPELRTLARLKRDYREQMQLLFLAGMARHQLQFGTSVSEAAMSAAGRTCMCTGYQNLRQKHRVRGARLLRNLCRRKKKGVVAGG